MAFEALIILTRQQQCRLIQNGMGSSVGSFTRESNSMKVSRIHAALVGIVGFVGLSYGLQAKAHHEHANGPCQQIKKACEDAGFVQGAAKKGNGLWVDCIDPIMKGTAQPEKATKALPKVDSSLVSECKAKHPKFGEGAGSH